MQKMFSSVSSIQQHNLQTCSLPASAPFEIHGGRDRGCLPGDDYLFQGYRYLYDVSRDVLVREDVNMWIILHQQ